MYPIKERWRYNVTSSLIGWLETQNDPCWYAIEITFLADQWALHFWTTYIKMLSDGESQYDNIPMGY